MNISSRAFDVAIPTPLTNEIPHLSIYNLLNKHLRNTWSREFVGKTSAQYGQDYESQKTMNGERSENYKPRVLEFSDPEDGQIYRANFEKINFAVDGALETEIDYLMHEATRYLSKLYPDDTNALITLTEAERQSYFNEALHMLHSYFDTEQLRAMDVPEEYQEFADFYYRYKFLTGITPVRSLTGVADQEEKLLNLLNTGTVNIYSGFGILTSPDQELVISNNDSVKYEKESLALDAFYFLSNQFFEKRGAIKLHGKTRSDNLEDLIKDTQVIMGLTEETVTASHEFTILNTEEPLELVDDLLHGKNQESKTFNLNQLFLRATKENLIKAASAISELKETVYGDSNFDWVSQDNVRLLFSQTAKSGEVTLVNSKDVTVRNPVDLENKILIKSTATLKDIDSTYAMQLGTAEYSEDFKLAIGNIVYSALTYDYMTRGDEFKLQIDTSVASDNLFIYVDVIQDNKLVFSGELNKEFLKDQNLNKVTSNYTYKSFLDTYTSDNLFSRTCLKRNLENMAIDITKPISIRYRNATIKDLQVLNSGTIYMHDILAGLEYDIYLTKSADGVYSAVLNRLYPETRTDINGEVTDTGFDILEAIVGNTDTEKLVNTTNATLAIGSISKSGNELTITLFGDTVKYTLPEDNIVFERNLEVLRGDKIVGGFVLCTVNQQSLMNLEYIDRLPDYSRSQKRIDRQHKDFGEKLNGELIKEFDTTVQIAEEKFKKATLTESATAMNTMYLDVTWYDTLLNMINNHTVHFTTTNYDDLDRSKYIYSTAYSLNASVFEDSKLPITIVDLSKILFDEADPAFFELKSVECYLESEDTLRLEEDITEFIDLYGRLNCIILDGYGNVYPTRVYKSTVKDSYCYVKIADPLTGAIDQDNREGRLILDLQRKAEVNSALETSSRRNITKISTYRFGNNLKYFQKQEWASLAKEHLVYDFNNVYSPTVLTTYADNTNLSKHTVIPASLSQSENLTILDMDATELDNLQLFKDLLNENKSLYLDSSIKILVNVPMSTKVLVRNEKYKTTSYVYSGEVPSTISFYNYKGFDTYEPLQEYLDAIDKNEVTLSELTTQVSRRIVIWGNVVWDANNVNKSVRTLRTIWSGYFANFEIYSSDDVLPPEALVKSSLNSSDRNDTRNINICNYNYAENKGIVDTNWILSTIISTADTEKMTATALDAYSHPSEITESEYNIVNEDRYLQITGFSLTANRINASTGDAATLTTCDADISRLLLDVNLKIKYVKNLMSVKYDTEVGQFTFTANKDLPEKNPDFSAGTSYPLNLLYGMVHMKGENFMPVGCLRGMAGGDTATNMLLEHLIYDYYNNTFKVVQTNDVDVDLRKVFLREKFGNLTDRALDFYASTLSDNTSNLPDWEAGEKIVSMKDVLDYAYNLCTYPEGKLATNISSSQIVPCIAELQESGEVILHYFLIVKEPDETYTIYASSVTEMITGDLVKSIMPKVTNSFQVKPSVYNSYITTIQSCQEMLPSNATGMPRNFDIDVDMYLDPEAEKDDLTGKPIRKIRLEADNNLTADERLLKEQFIETINNTDSIIDALGQTVDTRFKDLNLNNALVDNDKLILKDRSFKFEDSAKYFKEYYPTTVQMSLGEPLADTSEIERCILNFSNRNLSLANEGYLYLYDLKAPNRRSDYTASRESKVVERDYKLNNLHIVGYKFVDNKVNLLLQDSNRSYTNFVKSAIDLIKPVNGETEQDIIDNKLTLGFNWVDPGIQIDYTYYKRKCIFEGELSSLDPTRIYLADPDLNADEEFKLTDHVTVGDSVQIILNDPSGYYQGERNVSLDLKTGEGYEGPYKVIYTASETTNTGAVQHIILSGPGNLVYVSIPLNQDGGEITYSQPIKFGSGLEAYYAYALSTGEIVFLNLTDKQVYQITTVDNVIQNYRALTATLIGDSVMLPATPRVFDTSAIVQNSDGSYKINVSLKLGRDNSYEDQLFTKHDEWYTFSTAPVPGTEEGDETAPQSASDVDESEAKDVNMTGIVGENLPAAVFTNIPLSTGRINFDNKDRIFFEPDYDDEEQETAWLALPDKAEMFDASGHTGAFEIVEADSTSTILGVNVADKTDLVRFIRKTLSDMFKSISAGSLNAVINAMLAKELTTNPGTLLSITENSKADLEAINNTIANTYQSFADLVDIKYQAMNADKEALAKAVADYQTNVKATIDRNTAVYVSVKDTILAAVASAIASIDTAKDTLEAIEASTVLNKTNTLARINALINSLAALKDDLNDLNANTAAELTAASTTKLEELQTVVDKVNLGMTEVATLDMFAIPQYKEYKVVNGEIQSIVRDDLPFNPYYYINHPDAYEFSLVVPDDPEGRTHQTVTKYAYDMPLSELESKYGNAKNWNKSIQAKQDALVAVGFSGVAAKLDILKIDGTWWGDKDNQDYIETVVADAKAITETRTASKTENFTYKPTVFGSNRTVSVTASVNYTAFVELQKTYKDVQTAANWKYDSANWNALVKGLEMYYLEALENSIRNNIANKTEDWRTSSEAKMNNLLDTFNNNTEWYSKKLEEFSTIDTEEAFDKALLDFEEIAKALNNAVSAINNVSATVDTGLATITAENAKIKESVDSLTSNVNTIVSNLQASEEDFVKNVKAAISKDKEEAATKINNVNQSLNSALKDFLSGKSEAVASFIAEDRSENFTIVDNNAYGTEPEASIQDVANSTIARLLSRKSTGAWNPEVDDIYLPVFGTMDMPIYFKTDEDVKWQKIKYIESSSTQKIEEASVGALREFAEALLPVRYVSRECAVITSHTKNGSNIVAWDQNTNTLTIMDKSGNLKKRIAIPMLGIDHPILSTGVTLDTSKYPKRVKAYATSNMLYAKSTIKDLKKYMHNLRLTGGIIDGDLTLNTIYELFGLRITDSGMTIDTNAELYLPSQISKGKAPEGKQQEFANLKKLCEDPTAYAKWLKAAYLEDYLTTSTFDYTSFKNPGSTINIALLSEVFENTSLSSTIDSIIKNLTSIAPAIVKGVPYIDNKLSEADYNNFLNGMLTGMPTAVEGTYNFESLVKTSSLEVTNGYAHIFGTIDWPRLDEVRDRAKIAIENAFTKEMSNADALQKVIDEIISRFEVQLQNNFTTLTGEKDYVAGERSFKVTVDLSNYYVSGTQVHLGNDDNTNDKIISIASSNDGLKVITNTKVFNLGDETAKVISPDPEEITTFEQPIDIAKGPIALVFDALRSSGSIADFSIAEDATVQMITRGGYVDNSSIFYSTVSFVGEKELRLRDDTIVLDEGVKVRGIVLVKDQLKDNFQLGFGNVTNLETLPTAMTLFEVNSAHYADFATYSNKASYNRYNTELAIYEKDSVFDHYPTYEVIDEDKRKNFYKFDSDGKLDFLKNAHGRYVLRISEIFGETLGGRIVSNVDLSSVKYQSIEIPEFGVDETGKTIQIGTKTVALNLKKTVANEDLNTETLKMLSMDVRTSNDRVNINDLLLPEARAIGKSYDRLVNTYSTQKIPALVNDPWDAVISYPYKSITLDNHSTTNIKVDDDYLVASFDIDKKTFETTLAEYLTTLTMDSDGKVANTTTNRMLESNIAQTNVIDKEATGMMANVTVANVLLRIINETEVLPKLKDVTKIASKVNANGDLVYDTSCTELYIPEKGYGQALLGAYTIPQDCLFEDKIFYDSKKATLNKDGKQLVLVHENGEHYKDGNGEDIKIPKMMYKSFIQANTALDTELATKFEIELKPTLIDMSKFNVTAQTVSCETLDVLNLLDFSDGSEGLTDLASGDKTYSFFRSNVKFACKLCWSELPKDATTSNVLCISDADIDTSYGYTTNELLNALGFTRIYKSLLIPANVRYKTVNDTYQITSSLIARNLKAYSTDENGNVIYLDEYGEPTTVPTINFEPVCAPKASKDLNMFTVTDSKISTIVNNVFYYSRYCLSQDMKTNSIVFDAATGLRSLLMLKDPNKATSTHTNIEDVTEDSGAWGKSTSFKFKFKTTGTKRNSILIDLIYTKSVKSQEFNIAYLKDAAGQTIAKVYFEEPISSENLLIFQKNS